MADIFQLAAANLVSPVILCFALELAAALARSDLSVPEAAVKALSIYLLFAIGFKGGVSVAGYGFDGTLLAVSGGGGRSGSWTREGEVSRAGGMTLVLCIVRDEKLDTVLETAFAIVEKHIGVVTVTDCNVLRAERF